jgi:hypothetical protein
VRASGEAAAYPRARSRRGRRRSLRPISTWPPPLVRRPRPGHRDNLSQAAAACARTCWWWRVWVTRWVPVTHAGGGYGELLDPRRVMGRVTGVEIVAGGGCGFLPPTGFCTRCHPYWRRCGKITTQEREREGCCCRATVKAGPWPSPPSTTAEGVLSICRLGAWSGSGVSRGRRGAT